jgi:hypothetical protein
MARRPSAERLVAFLALRVSDASVLATTEGRSALGRGTLGVMDQQRAHTRSAVQWSDRPHLQIDGRNAAERVSGAAATWWI